MTIVKYIDLSGEWNFQKITNLSFYFLNKSGPHQDIQLFINYTAFNILKAQYDIMKIHGAMEADCLRFHTIGGTFTVFYTNVQDHCFIFENNAEFKYIITDKIDEYKESFDDLVYE